MLLLVQPCTQNITMLYNSIEWLNAVAGAALHPKYNYALQ
jgi:hypothetical protein